jgi:prepilin-type N-terminal cleavage/methylation domain-containing protein
MRTKAFTLIEVMVVMAIISILAGMMAPAVWKFWESEEIATTRQRMRELKIAMIGDKSLIQNGVRTHFGFVGDFGTLPFRNSTSCAFKFLNSSADMTLPQYDAANWSGRYLSSSSDPNDYALDAWGYPIRCTNKIYSDGRMVGLTLSSVTPNGQIIEETIEANDVIPTNRVAGNVTGTIPNLLKIIISPEKTGAFSNIETCKQLNGFSSYTTLLPYKLPIGMVNIELKTGSDCSSPTLINKFNYFVQDNLKVIKMPDLNNP